MRRAVLFIALVSLACARDDEAATDTTAAMEPAPVQALALSDIAGTWDGQTRRVGNDTVVANTVLNATPDTTGWTLEVSSAANPQTRSTARVQSVRVSGDSLVFESERFRSVLRPTQQVTVRTVYRMENGRLVGTTTATYADGETTTLRSEATRR